MMHHSKNDMIMDSYTEKMREIVRTRIKAKINGRDILLEYSESQKCFHFNYLDSNGRPMDAPSKYYMPIGYITNREFSEFEKTIERGQRLEQVENAFKTFMYGKL